MIASLSVNEGGNYACAHSNAARLSSDAAVCISSELHSRESSAIVSTARQTAPTTTTQPSSDENVQHPTLAVVGDSIKADSDPSVIKADSDPSVTKIDSDPSVTKIDSDPSVIKADSDPSVTKIDSDLGVGKAENAPSVEKAASDRSVTDNISTPADSGISRELTSEHTVSQSTDAADDDYSSTATDTSLKQDVLCESITQTLHRFLLLFCINNCI